MKQIRKSGITIVTLVITVIILVILTGAVMLTMVGDNGIFRETQTTIDKYNKQAMLEQIQLKIQKKRLAKLEEGQYTLRLQEDILPILETFGTYNENEMKLTTTEKNIDIYLYEIVNIPINEIANVTYTNQELTITEKVSLPNGYTFEYTQNNGITWNEYTNKVTIAEENGILIRLKNEEGKVVSSEYKVTSGVIEEIDSTKPIISIDTNGVTTGKTIKVTIIVTDEKGLDRNNTYEYCISTSNNDITGATWIPYTNGISFTVGEGLTGGYYIHVKGVTDTAGNESGNKVSEMLTFDNIVPAITIDIGRITDTSIEVLAQSTDNSGQVKSTEYSIDNGQTWKSTNTFTNLTANTEYTIQVKSVDIFNNENIEEKQVTTNPRTWNGKIDISWYTKDPNKTTFDISTPNELAGLAILVDNEIVYYDDPHDANATSGTYSIEGTDFEGKTIVLNNDILLNENVLNEDGTLNEANESTFVQWEPIGTPSNRWDEDTQTQVNLASSRIEFAGEFDGKNYTVKGMYINVGIEWNGALFGSSRGTISNTKVEDGYIKALGGHMAGIVGFSSGTVENCSSSVTINQLDGKGNFVGGVVGYGMGTISDCYNTGKIDAQKCVGGIIGGIYDGYNTQIIECYNTGVITGVSGQVGGVVGDTNGTTLVSCYNTGVITGDSSRVGGVVGSANGTTLVSCYNTGVITGDSSRVGGVVGNANGTTVKESYNLGAVVSNGENVGGLVGQSNGVINSCYNDGEVTGYNVVGGVVGNITAGHVINSYNIAKVVGNGDDMVGGVSGCNNGAVINSYNLSEIRGSYQVAGISAYLGSNIYNCYNVGDIYAGINVTEWGYGMSRVGGIAGRIGYLDYVYNLGNVYAEGTYVGGIYGAMPNGSVTNAFNMGNATTTKEGATITKPDNQVDTDIANLSVTINGSTYTTLLDALNAWVDANKSTYPELKNWVMGDNGYPTFEE